MRIPWPFVSGARYRELEQDRDYWRAAWQRLADAALVKAGVVNAPVMRDPFTEHQRRPLEAPETRVMAALAQVGR